MKKKMPLSLLEVIIALALSAILLTVLFQFFHHYSVSNIEIQKVKGKVLTRQCMHQRLCIAFSELAAGEEKKCLYTPRELFEGSSTLVWKNRQGSDLESTQMLYYVKGRGICLTTWLKNKERRDEVLFSDATSMTMEFFGENSKGNWVGSWEKKEEIPSMVKLKLKDVASVKEPLTFTYFLK